MTETGNNQPTTFDAIRKTIDAAMDANAKTRGAQIKQAIALFNSCEELPEIADKAGEYATLGKSKADKERSTEIVDGLLSMFSERFVRIIGQLDEAKGEKNNGVKDALNKDKRAAQAMMRRSLMCVAYWIDTGVVNVKLTKQHDIVMTYNDDEVDTKPSANALESSARQHFRTSEEDTRPPRVAGNDTAMSISTAADYLASKLTGASENELTLSKDIDDQLRDLLLILAHRYAADDKGGVDTERLTTALAANQ